MFKLPWCRRKKNQNPTKHISSGRVSDTPATKTSTESPTQRTPHHYRPVNKRSPKEPADIENGQRSGPQQSSVASSHHPAATAAPAGHVKTEKSRWRSRIFDFFRIFDCCRKRHQVAPAAGVEGEQRTPQEPHTSPVKATDGTPYTSDEVVKFIAPTEEEEEAVEKEDKKEKKKELFILSALWVQTMCQTVHAKQEVFCNSAQRCYTDMRQAIRSQSLGGQHSWFGFPNPVQMCYMNSSLQSLITLADFIRDISCQEDVWTSVPKADLIRRFMNIVLCHRSTNHYLKLQALSLFKRALSVQAPEFQDNFQKDAHEFLTSFLDQIRSLSPLLQEVAARGGGRYRCPVENHLMFKMQNTRTCKSCGTQSVRKEDFTNLSLNLVPGCSVQNMLQDNLMETELDFRCDCGANTSSQQSTFATLPKVLMLHLKRFRFTPLLQLEKMNNPVDLYRELLVSSSQADGWYSLVSVISHLGYRVDTGHYVSNGVHPDVELDDPADCWLNYNDAVVTQTTGASVCKLRQQTAYILFYQRRM